MRRGHPPLGLGRQSIRVFPAFATALTAVGLSRFYIVKVTYWHRPGLPDGGDPSTNHCPCDHVEDPAEEDRFGRHPRRIDEMRPRSVVGVFVAVLLMAIMSVPTNAPPRGTVSKIYASGPAYWGVSETFWNVSTGTCAPTSFDGVTLLPWQATDSVVLGGWLYIMTRANMIGTVATYAPSGPVGRTNDWNISAEIIRPREDSAYMAANMMNSAGRQALVIYATNETGDVLAGVQLVTGTPENESISVFDASTSLWTRVSDDLRPAYTHDSESFGLRADRYIVSFAHASLSSSITVTVRNTGSGMVFSQDLILGATGGLDSPRLRFDVDIQTGKVAAYNVASGWVVDNLVFRSMQSRYPIVEPVFESVAKSEPLWLQIHDAEGMPVTDADVAIEGIPATYNATDQRYEADVPRDVDWDVPFNYSAVVDGVAISDVLRVTTKIDPVNRLTIPRWWNGWDWVTVFGRDDSYSATSAPQTFAGFDHPATSYMLSTFSGNSTDLLETQSEIALHFPHDYQYWGHKTWSEAVSSAELGHSTLENVYWFASKWDDPRYVGVGDMYISLANPGNSGSWEQVFAEYEHGTRIAGIAAQYYLGGNSSLLGSYWLYGSDLTKIPDWASWDPYTRMDMMDMFRAVCVDNVVLAQWDIARAIAENHGVLRLYSHGPIAMPSYLTWLSQPKTNLSYENWKATDGEVASYVYGRASTDVVADRSSTSDRWVYDISRRDPIASGYWRVPVTVAIDISDRYIDDIQIKSGHDTLRMSDGSLPNLSGSRIMGVGYDIRGNTLYVSHFWNESSTLTISVYTLYNPRIKSEPKTSGLAYDDYSTTVTCTEPDAGSSSWALIESPDWLSILGSNDTSCLLGGFPTQPGVYKATIAVWDDNSSSYLNWSITISRVKIVTGLVMDSGGQPIPGLTVMVTLKDGPDVRTVAYATTNETGYYSVVFFQGDWLPQDTIEVTSAYDNETVSNTSVADNYPYQQIDLRFAAEIPEFVGVAGLMACVAIFALVTSYLIFRRRR